MNPAVLSAHIRWPLAIVLAAAVGSAFARAPDTQLIQNPQGRSFQDLGGAWHVIPDPYENGYFNHRSQPREDGWFLAREPADPAELVEYDFRRSPTLQVPGDWNTQDERFFFYEGTMWYFREFDVQPRDDHRYVLHFGAVNYLADVWLNGRYLGRHEGGFTPFQFEVTDGLASGRNFVVIKSDNRREAQRVPALNTDWWNYGGITRPVRLIELPESFIADYRLRLSGDGGVEGWVRVDGGKGRVRVSLPALQVDEVVRTDGDGMAHFRFDASPATWSPDFPLLYEAVFEFGEDRVTDQVGFRTIAVDGENILLNGEPVFLRGISIHEESLLHAGRAWSEEDARALLQQARDLGCNFVRLAHYPHNENMLRVADRMGLMVWAEIPVYWTIDFDSPEVLETARRQLDEMIARDANRVSIVLWSMANETPVGEARQAFIAELATHARQLDPSRLITAALDTQSAEGTRRIIDDPLAATVDVIGINSYCGWYGGVPEDCAALRWESAYGKPVILSEMGAGALQGLHGDAGHRWTEEYQARVYVHNLEMAGHMAALRGLSPWILKDFRSPRRPLPGIQDFWNRKGLLSETGVPKKAWFVLRDWYRTGWKVRPAARDPGEDAGGP